MNRKQALVLLIPGFPGSEEDSTCLPMQQQFVRSVMVLYPDVTIIVLGFQYPYHKEPYQWHGASVYPYNGRNRGGFARIWLRTRIDIRLRKIKRAFNIIGVLSFWYGECAVSGKKFSDHTGIRHLYWLMGQDARKGNKYPARIQLQAKDLVALSDFLQAEFEKSHGVRPFYVIPPGVYDLVPQKVQEQIRDIDLLAVGSLIPLKRFAIVLHIAATLVPKYPQLRVQIIGKGPQLEELQILSGKLGIDNHVRFTGELNHEEVLHRMSRSKILLHPSEYEGYSGVCQEALAMGVQVISFCRAMNVDVAQWHIVNTPEEMQNLAEQLLNNPQQEFKPVRHRSMKDTAREMMNIFLKKNV